MSTVQIISSDVLPFMLVDFDLKTLFATIRDASGAMLSLAARDIPKLYEPAIRRLLGTSSPLKVSVLHKMEPIKVFGGITDFAEEEIVSREQYIHPDDLQPLAAAANSVPDGGAVSFAARTLVKSGTQYMTVRAVTWHLQIPRIVVTIFTTDGDLQPMTPRPAPKLPHPVDEAEIRLMGGRAAADREGVLSSSVKRADGFDRFIDGKPMGRAQVMQAIRDMQLLKRSDGCEQFMNEVCMGRAVNDVPWLEAGEEVPSGVLQKMSKGNTMVQAWAAYLGLQEAYVIESLAQNPPRSIIASNVKRAGGGDRHEDGTYTGRVPVSVSRARKTILLVEDDPDEEHLAMVAFRQSGMADNVVVARDGQEAVDYLLAQDCHMPSVIFLDINLPKLSGLEVLRHVRGNARTRTVPVVLLTSSDAQCDKDEGCRAGANSFVRKPHDFDEFVSTINKLGNYWLTRNAS